MSRSNQPNKPPLICTVAIEAETEKAFLFMQVEKEPRTGAYMGVRKAWFPKSQVEFTTDCSVPGDSDVFEVEIQRWIAEQKEFDRPAPLHSSRFNIKRTNSFKAPEDDIPF